jgi:hypothetical protein
VRGSHVHCVSIDRLGARLCPCGLVTATRWNLHHDLPGQTCGILPGLPPPTTCVGRVRAAHQPTSAGFELARSSRGFTTPVSLVHRPVPLTEPRPIRQCPAGPTSSRLLPPSAASAGSGCRQLHRPATTGQRRSPLTSTRNNSASWRTTVRSTVPTQLTLGRDPVGRTSQSVNGGRVWRKTCR